ncbi:hypothetical protein KJ761_01095 [Patescibacteria group bacterium]|nr:hypothetical protein [Patescibacteria group bacterium]
MNIGIDISREIELVIRAKENEEKQENLKSKKEGADWDKSDVVRAEKGGDKKISSELVPAARDLNNTLRELEKDMRTLDIRMHESGLDSEFNTIKRELREKLSSFLSY